MKKLQYLIIHCSATPEGKPFDHNDIIRFHTSPKPNGRGWDRPGYSDIILLDGTIVNIREYNSDGWVQANEVTYGASGYNAISRHICYIGGVAADGKTPKDTRTIGQKNALDGVIRKMMLEHPEVKIIGHNEVAKKACPSFNVQNYLLTLQAMPLAVAEAKISMSKQIWV
jgi:N-acetylmuramoyl-L-alanine amidase